MNILTDVLPDIVEVNGTDFEINTDFRASVEFAMMLENGERDYLKMLRPFFPNGLPSDIVGAFTAAVWFFRRGEDAEETKKEESTENDKKTDAPKAEKSPKRAYSFQVDADAIFADFWQYYGIDLSLTPLHWWKFRALLAELPGESNYKQRIYYRTCDLSELPKAEKKRIQKIRNEIAIENKGHKKMTLEERNKMMRDYVLHRTKTKNKGGG